MTDAFSDLARDEKRNRRYSEFIDKLVSYLKNPSEDSYGNLMNSAKETDSVNGGFWTGRTNIAKSLDEKLEKLEKGDKTEWARMLRTCKTCTKQYQKLKQISPFEGILFEVHYGNRYVELKSDKLTDLITEKLENGDFRTYDCDTYLAEINNEDLNITWVRCGILGKNYPRDRKGNPKDKKLKRKNVKTKTTN